MHIKSIRHIAIVFIYALTFSFAFGLVVTHAHAQSDVAQVEQGLKQISPEDEAKHRFLLAAPVNRSAFPAELSNTLNSRIHAAHALGEWPLLIATYKQAIELSSDARYRNELAITLQQRGDFEEATLWIKEAIAKASNSQTALAYTATLARNYYLQGDNENADKVATKALSDNSGSGTQFLPALTQARLKTTKTLVYERQGRNLDGLREAKEAETFARQAVQLLRNDRGALTDPVRRTYAYGVFVDTLGAKIRLSALTNKHMLDNEIREYLRIFQTTELTPEQQSDALKLIAQLRLDDREFFQANGLLTRSVQILTSRQYDQSSARITGANRLQALALIGQHHYPEALSEFQKLDALAGNDEALKARVRYPFERAVVYLYNNKALEALPLLASSSEALAKQYGNGLQGRQHFFTAQSSGLQGVALWRIGTPESKAQAYPLLQAAVQAIMSPENADYLESSGIRKELREMIFSTYIEAAAQTSPADALAALGIADWMRGGLVQEALGDAAVRAAASNSSLADLVRQDQDARNEIKGLRSFLSGEAGGGASPLPQVAAQMRERIALLEKTRADVQVKIKAAFPDYEKLVRPSPPTTANIQANLKADEALVVLQPTDSAVYVWAIAKDGAGVFNRASVTNAQLAALVKRLRGSLDVAGVEPNRRPAFDHAAAQEIYAKLLAPVQQGFSSKINLIVAAGGVLGQIPFGVLQTKTSPQATSNKASTSADLKGQALQNAPWLIKQAAITHVPSVAAWLSMRALPHKEAAQSMMAWGDPLFNLAMANTGKSTTGEVRKVVLTRASTSVDLENEDPRSAIKYANIPSLPETRDELTAIAKTLGADIAKDLILGSAATRESVLRENKNGELAKRRVVAFATHGLMAGDLPNLTQPALAMAGTKDDDKNVLAPLLTLEDVLTLKLNADWVVLSACNTAAADGKAEEALSGLARGFFYAGSRSLLVTHWAVDSDSAVQLTTETFKNYQSKPQEAKAESLRQAMLTVMNNPATAHPTYWAPYALVGDGAR